MSRTLPGSRASHARASPAEDGQISVLVLGMVAVALTLVLGMIGATSVQLARIQLLDAADAAALDAADAVDEDALYTGGLGGGVPLDDEMVQAAAADHLALRERPSRLESWQVGPGTGTPDGRTAVVTLSARARIPAISAILESFGGGVTVTVESRARSDLDG